jgi:hypothetical protein
MAITVLYRQGFGSAAHDSVAAQEFQEDDLGWDIDSQGYLTITRPDSDGGYPDPVGVFAPGIWLFVREQE